MYILTSGCSWSDAQFRSWFIPDLNCGWPKWPEIVGKELNIEVRNVARSGATLEYSMDQILEHIFSPNPPSAIIWQLTEWVRYNWMDRHIISPTWHFSLNNIVLPKSIREKRLMEEGTEFLFAEQVSYDKFLLDLLSIDRGPTGQQKILENALRMIYFVLEICNHMNIPIMIFQSDVLPFARNGKSYLSWAKILKKEMEENLTLEIVAKRAVFNNKTPIQSLKALAEFYDHYATKYVISNRFFQLIDKKYHRDAYGWPFMPQLGGEIIGHGGNVIGPGDGHPNAIGQEIMAEKILEELENRKWNLKEQ